MTARRSASSYPTSRASAYKHACKVSAHAEPAAETSEPVPGPLIGSLARRQPWRGVRRRQRGDPRHPTHHHSHHQTSMHVQFLHTMSLPGHLTGSLARRQPWRGVRRWQRGGPRHPITIQACASVFWLILAAIPACSLSRIQLRSVRSAVTVMHADPRPKRRRQHLAL